MTTIDGIRREMEDADDALRQYVTPWDEQDIRGLQALHMAVVAQQRALNALTLLVESDHKISAAHRGRIDALEMGL